MDRSVQCVGMVVGPSASWRIRWIDLCSVSAWWSMQVPDGEYDGSIYAVCRHGGQCKCQMANTMDRSVQCVGMEVSALLNHNVEEVFVQLFVLARLPTEMSPSQRRRQRKIRSKGRLDVNRTQLTQKQL